MAYNEKLADKVRRMLAAVTQHIDEKKMFGGLCFMVNEKMCIGIEKDRLMVRLDPAIYEEVIEMEGCTPMDFTGKIMKGFVFVAEEAVTTDKKLAYWVNLALDYNTIAKHSKKIATKKKVKK